MAFRAVKTGVNSMSMRYLFVIVLVFILIGAAPIWPHSRNWGYAPSGGLGLLLVVLLVLFLLGKL